MDNYWKMNKPEPRDSHTCEGKVLTSLLVARKEEIPNILPTSLKEEVISSAIPPFKDDISIESPKMVTEGSLEASNPENETEMSEVSSVIKNDFAIPSSSQNVPFVPPSSVFMPCQYQYGSYDFQDYSFSNSFNTVQFGTCQQVPQSYGCQIPNLLPIHATPFSGLLNSNFSGGNANPNQCLSSSTIPANYVGPILTTHGIITVLLRHSIRVDITIDNAIRLINFAGNCTAALNSRGNSSCISHPSGKILQEGTDVHMKTGNKLAKFSKKGITFTSMEHCLVYMVEEAGTTTTIGNFQDLAHDFPLDVFYSNSLHGNKAVNECLMSLESLSHRINSGGETWVIGGVLIKQSPLGDVRVTRDHGGNTLCTSPSQVAISVKTSHVYMSASGGKKSCVSVQKGEMSLNYNLGGFRVKNGNQKAGFDNKGQLKLN